LTTSCSDALLRGRNLGKDALAHRARISKRLDHFQKFRGERFVTCNGTGLDQHHSFPRLAPLRVIRLVTALRSSQRGIPAFGAQAHINPEQRALRRQAADFVDEKFGEAFEELIISHSFSASRRFPRRLLEKVTFFTVNEQQIYIGAVVQLLASQLAHAENGKFSFSPGAFSVQVIGLAQTLGELLAGEVKYSRQAQIGDVGDFKGDLGDIGQAREVARSDPQHLALLEFADLGHRTGIIKRLEFGAEQSPQISLEALFLPLMLKLLSHEAGRQPIRVCQQQFT
jgi:hypothetical protein